MASKERILRLKDETRSKILVAALDIVKEDGWQALSMRKIADKIEYTAPIIYEYFDNKDAILYDLTIQGYSRLTQEMLKAKAGVSTPEKQLEVMWLAYWNFAFDQTELYQLMFGVEVNCCIMKKSCPDLQAPATLFTDSIREIMDPVGLTEEIITTKYYTFWSVVHGLISINIVRKGMSDDINKQVLTDAIVGIINAIKK